MTTILKKCEISELLQLADLEALSAKYHKFYGSHPLNVSAWNPSGHFLKPMMEILKLPVSNNYINYHFSYSLDQRGDILDRLGFNSTNKGCLIVPTGSVAILMAVNLIKSLGFSRITAVCPTYFTLVNNCIREGITVEKLYAQRSNGTFSLPLEIEHSECSVPLWITNPYYCTGRKLSNADLGIVENMLASGRIIFCDECLALIGEELGRQFGSYDNYIGLYSPHKSLCVNGVKFSILAFPKSMQSYFDQWADAIYGCLSHSNVIAVEHFLSSNYSEYMDSFNRRILEVHKFIEVLAMQEPEAELDHQAKGYLISIYFPGIPAAVGSDHDFMWEIVRCSAGIFIPGTRNHFSPDIGLCFRINLALDSPQFRGTIGRLIKYIPLLYRNKLAATH